MSQVNDLLQQGSLIGVAIIDITLFFTLANGVVELFSSVMKIEKEPNIKN